MKLGRRNSRERKTRRNPAGASSSRSSGRRCRRRRSTRHCGLRPLPGTAALVPAYLVIVPQHLSLESPAPQRRVRGRLAGARADRPARQPSGCARRLTHRARANRARAGLADGARALRHARGPREDEHERWVRAGGRGLAARERPGRGTGAANGEAVRAPRRSAAATGARAAAPRARAGGWTARTPASATPTGSRPPSARGGGSGGTRRMPTKAGSSRPQTPHSANANGLHLPLG